MNKTDEVNMMEKHGKKKEISLFLCCEVHVFIHSHVTHHTIKSFLWSTKNMVILRLCISARDEQVIYRLSREMTTRALHQVLVH